MADGQAPRCAGFWMRLVAFLIDSVIASVILFPFGALTGDAARLERVVAQVAGGADPARAAQALREFAAALAAAAAWSTLLLLVVVVLLWRLRGATPGKMAIGARVVDARSLRDPSTAQAIGRFLAYFVSTVPLCLGFLWIAFDARKQGWHDKLAGTLVVYRRRGA